MRHNIIITVLFVLLSGMSAFVLGQTPVTVKPSVITGDVVSIGDKKIVVTAKTGQVDVALTDKTEFKRVSPENPSPSAAKPAALSDIGVGDKLMVTGILAADGKSIPARAVYLMTKADISQKHAKESEQWKTRGITGKVVTANTQTNQIEVELRSLTGSTKMMLTPKEKVKFLRYADDSVRYDEAKDSSITEIKAGDMLRALGDKSTDGTSFAAEEIITGAFQTIAGTVKSIDVAKNEVVMTNLQTKKDVTVVVSDTSVLKRFPAEQAERMAGFQAVAAGGEARPVAPGSGEPRPVAPGGAQSQRGAPGTAGQTPGGQGRGGFGGRQVVMGGGPGAAGGGGNIDEMLERFPTITPGDLKVGDMIAISSTKNANVDRIKAIKLLAGVEPFLRMAQATNGHGRGQGGVDQGFSIPGLDGVSFP